MCSAPFLSSTLQSVHLHCSCLHFFLAQPLQRATPENSFPRLFSSCFSPPVSSRLCPSGMAPSQPSHYACYLFLDGMFSTLLFDSFPAWRDCLTCFSPSWGSFWTSQPGLLSSSCPFLWIFFNSSDGEDISGELEAILATVEPQKSIRFIWSSSHTEYFWLF